MNESRLVFELLKATEILEVRFQDREVTGLVMCHGTRRHSLPEETDTHSFDYRDSPNPNLDLIFLGKWD